MDNWEYCAVVQLAFGAATVAQAAKGQGENVSFDMEAGVFTDEKAMTVVQFYARNEILKKHRLTETIAELGANGWEMCGHSRIQSETQSIGYWYFKRRME